VIIDFHTHVFPDEIRQRRERFLHWDAWFRELYGRDTDRLASAEDIVAEMDESGVNITVILTFPWADHGLCVSSNYYAIEAMRRYPGRLVGFAALQPRAGAQALAELERCIAAGMRGIGELNPDAQGFALDDQAVIGGLVEAATALDLPLLIHTSEPVGHQYHGKGSTTPEVIYRFVQKFPQVKLVCGHWGGGFPFYELMPEVKALAQNVYYDTAASPFLYTPAVFAIGASLVGAEKILFATDFPLVRQRRLLRLVRESGLKRPALRKVLGENAARLLHLEPRPNEG